MTSGHIIDSHIHLWPPSAANSTSHTWMTEGNPLVRPYLLEDYISAVNHSDTELAKQPSSFPKQCPSFSTSAGTKRKLLGAVYLETDRALLPGSTLPPSAQVSRWKHPLEEIAFLRKLIEGKGYKKLELEDADPKDAAFLNETIDSTYSSLLLALIPWAPVDQGPEVLSQYLSIAEELAGEATWSRVRGVRFLVQGLTDRDEFEDVVLSDSFVEGIQALGEKDWVFDVGVDQKKGGIWQLGGFANVIRRVREGEGRGGSNHVRFVLNHLCKPSLTSATSTDFEDWRRSITQFARFSGVYMKLSGSFSQLPPKPSSSPSYTAREVLSVILPWITVIFKEFGARRIMFGSDWPVCNLNGPGVEETWGTWREIVELALEEIGCGEEEKERVWWGTAKEAYFLEVD